MKNKSGKHISFYYYGQDHMVLNLYKFIKASLESNNFIYLYIDKSTYELLLSTLDDTEKQMIDKFNVENIIICDKENNYDVLQDSLNEYKSKKIKEGYNGIKYIFDARLIIENTTKNLFKYFLSSCMKTCNNTFIDILTLYDFGEYMAKNKVINDEIIKLSYIDHSHRLFANEVISIDEFQSDKCLAWFLIFYGIG